MYMDHPSEVTEGKYLELTMLTIYSRDSLMRPPVGLDQKWSLGEVVALVKE